MSLLKEGKSINIFKPRNWEILVLQTIWKRTYLANPTSTDLLNQENSTSMWALVTSSGPAYVMLDFCMAERNFKMNFMFTHTRFNSLLMF